MSFHVGSQQRDTGAWDKALESAAGIFRDLAAKGIELKMVNLGGGFPTKYLKEVPTPDAYGRAIDASLRQHFGNRLPETIIEPGRGMVGNAGVIQTEVVLIANKSANDNTRWVYLDIGKFGGLAETMDQADPATRSPRSTTAATSRNRRSWRARPATAPTVLYEEELPYPMPLSLEIGDKVLIHGTGAYTTTYSAVAFNGFAPLKAYYI